MLLAWVFFHSSFLMSAEVRLAPVFQDHMVLQRGMAVPVWGTAEAGARVVVTFAGQRQSGRADAGGHWRVKLASLPASDEPRTLAVTARKPSSLGEEWHDMKFWWPHDEAIIATLMAYELTGDEKYARWHQQVHDWAHRRFGDPEHGEWFGYLHRDGRLSASLKGNLWKGTFHHPRMQWMCWRMLEGGMDSADLNLRDNFFNGR